MNSCEPTAIRTLCTNEFGRVDLMPPYTQGCDLRAAITITKLPDDVVATLKSKKIRVVLPKRAYVQRQAQINGKWVDKHTLKLEGLEPAISIENRPGLAHLWQEEDDYVQGLSRQREERKEEDRQRFIDACPVGSVIVRHTDSMPDPWEAGLSIPIYSDDRGRKYDGVPDVRTDDGSLGYVTEEAIVRSSARISAREADDASKAKAESDRRQVEKEAESHRIASLTETARNTGTAQVLDRWVTDRCTRNNCDCSFDAAVKTVNPDGSIETTYTCCY